MNKFLLRFFEALINLYGVATIIAKTMNYMGYSAYSCSSDDSIIWITAAILAMKHSR